ncbi:MAG TPA: hypothetical protein VGO09_07995 [Flavisolibacter sp.]|jgi:hypothetical protein|nr:hypothetical protein [Flavisolibacter sp.]
MKKIVSWNNFSVVIIFLVLNSGCNNQANKPQSGTDSTKEGKKADAPKPDQFNFAAKTPVDTAKYNRLTKYLANGDSTGRWPAKAPYPLPGAILPFNRIVAFYGNLYSKKMGILGELPRDEMLAKLKGEVAKWQAADSTLPVIPALHYIAITAQGAPGKDRKHRLRMPFSQIDTMLNWAKMINGLVFLDIQVGHSNIRDEVQTLEKYLSMPNVHLGIDPEFSMKGGEVPGRKIGTYNAEDINAVIDYLAGIVKKNNLPPKILVVHRFTQGMVRGIPQIKKVPQVEIVMDMDGWGDKTLKKSSYILYEYRDPVQFTGFKLFYKNDIRKDSNGMYTPQEVLKFIPKPSYIQYQ